ncbi:MAG: putative lipid II flippase FtsW [Clostridiales bacterium]|nr:putative lipid II flippase FtsW [Clostridiales bacterium]
MAKKKRNKKVNQLNPFDFILFITVIVLISLGIIMVLSASSPTSLATTGSSYTYVYKQLISAIIGIVLMLIISRIDYRHYGKFYKIIYMISIGILLLVIIPGVGRTVNGARRWINIPLFSSVQPSEITKLGLIICIAMYLTQNKNNLKHIWIGFFKPIIIYIGIPVMILLVVQSHFSASMVICAVLAIMMIVAGSRLIHFFTCGSIGAGGLLGVMYIAAKFFDKGSFRLTRITAFLDPWADKQGSGWQIIQSLYAIGSGGLFGVGLGKSKQKYLYISEPHNDFIFAVLAEELGFVGCALVISLFAIFIWRGVVIAMKAPDMFGSLLAIGITALIGLQAIINIAVVTSSMPVTGIALPFFSYGGTSLIILLCAVGILLNISRQTKKI